MDYYYRQRVEVDDLTRQRIRRCRLGRTAYLGQGFDLSPTDAEWTQEQLAELRTDALRLFWIMSVVGYLVWHMAQELASSTSQGMLRPYLILPLPTLALIGTYVVFKRNVRLANIIFLVGWILSPAWASIVLGSSVPATFYPFAALVGAFIITPSIGVAITVVIAVIMIGLDAVSPWILGPSTVVQTVSLSLLMVLGVWILRRHLFVVLNWYAESYARAEQKTREAQEHRAELAKTLKQLDVAYYHLERANSALQTAWKAADEAERAKMELAVNLSHELRTPLNLISGYSEMMLTAPHNYRGVNLPAPYRADMSGVYRSAQHLLALTEDVLDLARVESGHLGLLREPVELGEIIRDAVALLQDFADAKGLALPVDVPNDLPPLVVDRLRIRQVLLNFLGNAVRMTDSGSVLVQVRRLSDHLRISIVDSGPGIAQEDIQSTFHPFVTRDRERSNWQRGAGLGLPISKQLIELHGGEVGVQSTLGVGTTFWFTLPLTPISGSASALARPGLVNRYRTDDRPLLLLTQCDAGVARSLQRHLGSVKMEMATSLATAARRAEEAKATVILAGFDSGSEVPRGSVPIIWCPLSGTNRKARKLGIADYLVKPVSRETLENAISRLECDVSRVLIADDDDRFVRMIERMLESFGRNYIVTTANNGAEALDKLQRDPPDLLLLDWSMPYVNGESVLRQMAQKPSLKNVKVLIISAHDEAEGSAVLGHDLRVYKPEGFHFSELTKVIDGVIRGMAPVRAYLSDCDREPGLDQAILE